MGYCTQAECLYLPIWENLPFALGGKGLSYGLHRNNFEKQCCLNLGVSEFNLTWTAGLERTSERLL